MEFPCPNCKQIDFGTDDRELTVEVTCPLCEYPVKLAEDTYWTVQLDKGKTIVYPESWLEAIK